jgi:hypothetical protein
MLKKHHRLNSPGALSCEVNAGHSRHSNLSFHKNPALPLVYAAQKRFELEKQSFQLLLLLCILRRCRLKKNQPFCTNQKFLMPF